MKTLSPQLASIFEERAENLAQDELTRWTSETARDKGLIRKLKGPGAKLLSGPRGSGKSTLLRRAYFSLIDDGEVLPAYINFSRSLALEPLFLRNANALQLFRQWVMFKIISGVKNSVTDNGKLLPISLKLLSVQGESFIHDLETGLSTNLPDHLVAPSQLLTLLETWTAQLNLSRCVLLMDDAAHAFSPEQQRDFFEIFRTLRSRKVSAKAAVYPGITSYSPFFHVGHEAELLQAWYSPDDPEYLRTMRDVAKKRLTSDLYDAFADRTELIDYLALASFGLPRGFLNMISSVLGVDDDVLVRPTRIRADQAISAHAASVRSIFSSLKGKLPRFKRFIDVGLELQQVIALVLRAFNANKLPGKNKAVTFGIAEPMPNELTRILEMAEYAGLLRDQGTISHGARGVYRRYTLHYAIILTENSLSLGASFPLRDVIKSLAHLDSHSFPRSRASTLLGEDLRNRCTLDLAPCQNCGAPRPSEDARFCIKCGLPLTVTSIYEELVNATIDKLPLTENKISGLLKQTRIRTVQDILLDEESKEIRKAKYVGPVWASRIVNAAQEYVSV